MNFKCIGGPFDGEKIVLSEDQPGTMEFCVPSFNNGEKGVYRPDSEHRNSVVWSPV